MRKLGLFVLIAHFSIVIALTIHHFASHRFKPSKPIVIRTVLPPQVQPKVIAAAPAPAASKPAPVAPKKAPAPPKPKPAATKTTAPKKQEKVTPEIPPPPKTTLNVPRKIQPKAEVTTDVDNLSYGELLIAYLQSILELPEMGEVKAHIKINARGALVDCEIIEAKSDRNAEFLRRRLPELTYPLSNDFSGASFTVTFRNS